MRAATAKIKVTIRTFPELCISRVLTERCINNDATPADLVPEVAGDNDLPKEDNSVPSRCESLDSF
jgi:hypothetical protein